MYWREEGITPEQKEKKTRVSSSYDSEAFEKLDRLSCACGISVTTLQTRLVEMCLNSEAIINEIQDKHKKRSRFRIIPTRVNNELHFIFAEKAKQVKRTK
jgi:hypothetical protein